MRRKKDPQTPAPVRPSDPVKEKRRAQARTRAVLILRIVLWSILGFIFVRGVLAIAMPDDEVSARKELAVYREQHVAEETTMREIFPFAEDFVREYLTYAGGAEADYKARLGRFAASSVYRDVTLSTGGSASVSSATGYRTEVVSATQFNVWVRATVQYTISTVNKETEKTTTSNVTDQVVLVVPVTVIDGRYIVDDTPVFSADAPLPAFSAEAYSGTSASETVTAQVSLALTNFYTAYYKEDESVIAYYLAPEADPDDFLGLHGKVTFKRIADCKVYLLGEGTYLALATVDVATPSGQVFSQHFNLRLIEKDGQFYIRSMDTRTSNLDN